MCRMPFTHDPAPGCPCSLATSTNLNSQLYGPHDGRTGQQKANCANSTTRIEARYANQGIANGNGSQMEECLIKKRLNYADAVFYRVRTYCTRARSDVRTVMRNTVPEGERY